MAKPVKPAPEIVRVAEELEFEIAQLESIARAAKKARLDSEKNIAKAAGELSEAVTMPARLAERLQALSVAMARMQERQQAALEPLTVFAAAIQQRTLRLGQHMEAFATLGRAAGEVSAALASAMDAPDETTRGAADARLQEIADGARALFEAARDDDFPEIAREADVLKQRMASLRKRLAR